MKLKLAAMICMALFVACALIAVDIHARARSAAAMADSANKFLNSLNADQKAKATFKFDDAQRFDWHFVPQDRKGLPLKEMTEAQQKLAMDFLKSGLSQRGYYKITTIMSLENVLREIEGPNRKWPRDPGLYYVSVFGTPGTKDKWGWRFEGHHFSFNVTLGNGTMVATSPAFFGSNPAEVRVEGPKKGLRVLGAEEDLGRDLLMSLDDKQRAKTIIDSKAYADIITLDKVKPERFDGAGIKASELTAAQFEKLSKLVEEYCNNVPEDLAAARAQKFKSAKKDQITIAWAGGVNRGDGHYYRVQGPSFLIEYDNTQNNNNHIHSVWRDYNGDFGRDLLAEHYREFSHNGKSAE